MIKNMLCEMQSGYNLNKEVSNNLYHNTKTLLKLYSLVSWRIETSLNELDLECQSSMDYRLAELFESLIDLDPRVNEVRMKSRLRNLQESKHILDLIDLSLNQLRSYPNDGEKYYKILHCTYIDRQAESIEALAEIFNVSRSTMYRNLNKAIKALGVMLWGYMINEIHSQQKTTSAIQS